MYSTFKSTVKYHKFDVIKQIFSGKFKCACVRNEKKHKIIFSKYKAQRSWKTIYLRYCRVLTVTNLGKSFVCKASESVCIFMQMRNFFFFSKCRFSVTYVKSYRKGSLQNLHYVNAVLQPGITII